MKKSRKGFKITVDKPKERVRYIGYGRSKAHNNDKGRRQDKLRKDLEY